MPYRSTVNTNSLYSNYDTNILETGARKLGIHLERRQLEQFRIYHRLLETWNTSVNLTSVTDWDEVQNKHFIDSLQVTIGLPESMQMQSKFVDIGTGAGFPGIPLKIVFPALAVTLVDSKTKKTNFLLDVVRHLELNDVEVITGRSENLARIPKFRENFDFVVSRAVSNMAALAELTLPFCRLGGLVFAHKTLNDDNEIGLAHKAINIVGGQIKSVHNIGTTNRRKPNGLVVLKKIRATPPEFPRRNGLPTKRPL